MKSFLLAACLLAGSLDARALTIEERLPPAAPPEATPVVPGSLPSFPWKKGPPVETRPSSEFGILERSSAGVAFRPTGRVPARPGQRYAWVVKLDAGAPSSVFVTETLKPAREVTLPKAVVPTEPSENAKPTAPSKAGTLIVEREAQVQDGVVFGVWIHAAGDPVGRHVLEIDIEGQPQTWIFEFDIE